jgi:hypothetical protein
MQNQMLVIESLTVVVKLKLRILAIELDLQ